MKDNINSSKEMLFVFPGLPCPPRENGLSIRYYPIIDYLSEVHTIDILILGEKGNGRCKELFDKCRNVYYVAANNLVSSGWLKKIRLLFYYLLPWTPPLRFTFHNPYSIADEIRKNIPLNDYNCIIWVADIYSHTFMHLSKDLPRSKLFYDFIDSPYLLAKRRALADSRFLLIRMYEQWKTGLWERRISKRVNKSIYISPVDAKSARLGRGLIKCQHVIPNGIYVSDYIDKMSDYIHAPSIGYLGNMGYTPNIEAVNYLYENIYLKLKDSIPDISLYIIGRNPSDDLLKLNNIDGVYVTGEVDSIWPFINSVDVFVLPILSGAGLKNKILEIMYAKKPVVTTPLGNEGIDAAHGRHITICEEANEFVDKITELMNSQLMRNQLGGSGYKFVIENFTWEGILKKYEKLLCD